MLITIPNHKCVSWNDIYEARHWIVRKRIADQVHAEVKFATKIGLFKNPVAIDITAYRVRPIDPDNVCAKLYIDGLKGRVIEDDRSKWVSQVSTRCVKCSKGEERVEIHISEV